MVVHNAVMDHAIQVRQGERTIAEVPEKLRADVSRALRDNAKLRDYYETVRPKVALDGTPFRLGRVTTF